MRDPQNGCDFRAGNADSAERANLGGWIDKLRSR
jgi:hypothetical protein